jgi:hypothetical protein
MNKLVNAAYFHAYYLSNKDKITARSRARYATKRDEIREKERAKRANATVEQRTKKTEYNKQWRKDHPGCRRKEMLKSFYGLSLEAFQNMLRDQEHRCAICKREFTAKPCIDHNHGCCPGIKSCGKCVRGILCNRCNVSLHILENPQLLNSAKKYLAKWGNHAERLATEAGFQSVQQEVLQ